jgi:Cu(I)/Ag(I) efflux system periplasmic protein CusF
MRKLLVFILIAAFAAFAWLALPGLDEARTSATGSGLVQRIDVEKGMVTISHGPVPALNMTPMTMTFSVRDRGQLANLKPLQKVEFELTYDGKDYEITDIR